MKFDLPLVIDGKELAVPALDLLAALAERLSASVALQDFQRREAHTRMNAWSGWWWDHPLAPDEIPIGVRDPDGETLSARINWRWKLWVVPQSRFPAVAFALVLETAKKLERFLPAEEMPDVPVAGGGPPGGTASPAELAIPVDWAKTKN